MCLMATVRNVVHIWYSQGICNHCSMRLIEPLDAAYFLIELYSLLAKPIVNSVLHFSACLVLPSL